LPTDRGGGHVVQHPIRPQQQAIAQLFQAAIHEANRADIPLTAYEPTCGLKQACDRRRPESDVKSIRTMIVPYRVAFDLWRRQRQAGDHHAYETLSGEVDSLAENPTRDGESDACAPIRMGQGMQERHTCRVVHARRLAQHVGFQGTLLEFRRHRRGQGFEEAEGWHEYQMMPRAGLGSIDDQANQRRRRPLPGHLSQIEIRHQQHLAVFRRKRTRQRQAKCMTGQAQHRIQQVRGREGRGKQNEALPPPMLPRQGECRRHTA